MAAFHFGDPVAPAFHFVDPAAPAFHFGDPVPVGIPVAAVGDPVAVGIPVDAVGGPVAAPQAQDVGIPVAAVADPVPQALNHWFPDSNDITLRYCAPETPIAHLVEFFKQQHLISGQKHCATCHTPMDWVQDRRRVITGLPFYWICKNSECARRYKTKTPTDGSWFHMSRIELKKWLQIMAEFAWGTTYI